MNNDKKCLVIHICTTFLFGLGYKSKQIDHYHEKLCGGDKYYCTRYGNICMFNV